MTTIMDQLIEDIRTTDDLQTIENALASLESRGLLSDSTKELAAQRKEHVLLMNGFTGSPRQKTYAVDIQAAIVALIARVPADEFDADIKAHGARAEEALRGGRWLQKDPIQLIALEDKDAHSFIEHLSNWAKHEGPLDHKQAIALFRALTRFTNEHSARTGVSFGTTTDHSPLIPKIAAIRAGETGFAEGVADIIQHLSQTQPQLAHLLEKRASAASAQYQQTQVIDWLCTKTETPADKATRATEQAAKKEQDAADALTANRQIARFFGGKALSGTAKQKPWGEEIRANILQHVAEDSAIALASPDSLGRNASFWINNRERQPREFADFIQLQQKLMAEHAAATEAGNAKIIAEIANRYNDLMADWQIVEAR